MGFEIDEDKPREVDAQTYLRVNRIMDLVDNMTAMLIHARPDDPKEYLAQQLEKLKAARQSGTDFYPCLFDESNLVSTFGMLDPTKRGYISRDQYSQALSTMGAISFNEYPEGSESNRISMETFLSEAKAGLSKASATFKK